MLPSPVFMNHKDAATPTKTHFNSSVSHCLPVSLPLCIAPILTETRFGRTRRNPPGIINSCQSDRNYYHPSRSANPKSPIARGEQTRNPARREMLIRRRLPGNGSDAVEPKQAEFCAQPEITVG